MKVASYFTLKNTDQNLFNLWIKTLPLKLKGGHYELLWRKCKGMKSVLWTERDGFIFM